MPDFEPTLSGIKETFCDMEPPQERAFVLGYMLSKDILLPKGFLDRGAVRGDVLDLGCGRGSLGAALKVINREIRLVGVDIIPKYNGETFNEEYSEIRKNDAAKEVAEIKKNGQKFDLIISCGMPSEATEDLIGGGNLKDIVKPGGSILLIFDAPVGDPFISQAKETGFELHNGTLPSDPDILYWHNGSKSED